MRGALLVGSPQEVIDKIMLQHSYFKPADPKQKSVRTLQATTPAPLVSSMSVTLRPTGRRPKTPGRRSRRRHCYLSRER